jgi:hypothetical protein
MTLNSTLICAHFKNIYIWAHSVVICNFWVSASYRSGLRWGTRGPLPRALEVKGAPHFNQKLRRSVYIYVECCFFCFVSNDDDDDYDDDDDSNNNKFWEELIYLLFVHKLSVHNIQCNHLRTKFHWNPPIGSKVRTQTQTDRLVIW